MSKTTLATVEGFTPVIDTLVEKYEDFMTAAVFGMVWRYCQLKDGKCTASHDTLAKRMGVDRRTIMRHLKKLVADGYLAAKHEAGQKTLTYFDTGKAGVDIKVSARAKSQTAVTESHTEESPVTKSDSTCDKLSQISVTESHTKILVKKEIKIQERQAIFAGNDIAMTVFRDVAKYTPAGTDWLRAIELVRDVLRGNEDFGRDELVEYLKTYAADWTAQVSKGTGRKYSIRNLVWLERAAAGEALFTPPEVQTETPAVTPPPGGIYV